MDQPSYLCPKTLLTDIMSQEYEPCHCSTYFQYDCELCSEMYYDMMLINLSVWKKVQETFDNLGPKDVIELPWMVKVKTARFIENRFNRPVKFVLPEVSAGHEWDYFSQFWEMIKDISSSDIAFFFKRLDYNCASRILAFHVNSCEPKFNTALLILLHRGFPFPDNYLHYTRNRFSELDEIICQYHPNINRRFFLLTVIANEENIEPILSRPFFEKLLRTETFDMEMLSRVKSSRSLGYLLNLNLFEKNEESLEWMLLTYGRYKTKAIIGNWDNKYFDCILEMIEECPGIALPALATIFALGKETPAIGENQHPLTILAREMAQCKSSKYSVKSSRS